MNAINRDLLIECLAKMALNYLEEQHNRSASVESRAGLSEDRGFPTGQSNHDSCGDSPQTAPGGEQ